MTTHIGNEGTIKIGSNTLGELRSWSIEETVETVDDSAIGDASDTHLVGSKAWSGEASCAYDADDTNGQVALAIGASVALNVYAYGTTTGNKYLSGTVTVTKVGRQASRNGLIEQSFSFKGNGALSIATA